MMTAFSDLSNSLRQTNICWTVTSEKTYISAKRICSTARLIILSSIRSLTLVETTEKCRSFRPLLASSWKTAFTGCFHCLIISVLNGCVAQLSANATGSNGNENPTSATIWFLCVSLIRPWKAHKNEE